MTNPTERPRIGIIGGTGPLGRWFEALFRRDGYDVLACGRRTELTCEELARKCDIVILSLPVEAAMGMCEVVGPMLSERQLFTDFCSLKETVVEEMAKHSKAEVMGSHPLFGPSVASLEGQNVVVCPKRPGPLSEDLVACYKRNGATISEMSAPEHDQCMAVVQGLIHMLSICMGRTLQKLDIRPEAAIRISTPVFRLKAELVGRLFSQDLSLYTMLVEDNPHFPSVLETFLSSVDEARGRMHVTGPEGFESMLENIREYLGPYCKKAQKETDSIFDHLYRNFPDRPDNP